jgi:hypothetical protein
MDAAPHPDDVERSDADPRLIAALAAGIAVFLAASPVLLRVIYPSATRIAGIERDLPQPAPPVLEVKPKLTLQTQRAREDALLEGYGQINRDGRVVRIPIERAMQLIAERGLDGWPSAAAQSSR